jgi:protein TonB
LRSRWCLYFRSGFSGGEDTMFAGIDTLGVNPRRRWTTLGSFTLQAAVLAAAFVLPLLYPQGLPDAVARRPIFVPLSAPEPPSTTGAQDSHQGRAGSVAYARRLIVNRDNGAHFPGLRAQAITTEAPPDLPPGTGNAGRGPDLARFLPPTVSPVLGDRPPISVMMQGNLIYRFEPVYPAIAKMAGVQGTVLIKAVISAQGRIGRAQVVTGSPLLARAALDAVKQWRYRPYYLNGVPVEVETEITVYFVLR